MTKRCSLVCLGALVAFCFLAVEAKFKVQLDQQQGDLFEGDVPLNKKLRNGIMKAARWADKTVVYDYGISVGADYTRLVDGALKEIEQNTCVRFKRRTNEQNFLRIINGTGCYSPVGQVRGMQYLSLMDSDNRGSCWYHEVILHEFLHAVGLWHEQSRYDRDNWITIDTRSVPAGTRFNFDIVNNQWSSVYNTPYDYYSVMHYGKTAFSQNNQITIYPKDNRYLDVIGNQKRGSANDWAKVNQIYDCGNTGSISGTGNTGNSGCTDSNTSCAYWASTNECNKNPNWMKTNCRKSCKQC